MQVLSVRAKVRKICCEPAFFTHPATLPHQIAILPNLKPSCGMMETGLH